MGVESLVNVSQNQESRIKNQESRINLYIRIGKQIYIYIYRIADIFQELIKVFDDIFFWDR